MIARLLATPLACLLLLILQLAVLQPAAAEDSAWHPSRFGADDTLGAINLLSPEKVLEAVKLVKHGKTYSLGIATGSDTPTMPHRRFDLTVVQHPGNAENTDSERLTANDDLFSGWMGTGSQIDGLGHVGYANRYYNGLKGDDFITVTGLTQLSIDKLPPIVTRGVLLDMARHFGMAMLPKGKAFNRKDIKAAAKAQGVAIREGDVVLFHTGWINLIGKDNTLYQSGEPGIDADGAEYLAGLGVVAIGSDTWALEVYPPKGAHVHPMLLAKYGVYILENMDTRELAKDRAHEFLFVLGQPKFKGAVQSIINPIAIR